MRQLLRTPDGQFTINQTATNANTALFVYEVASGVVLRNRTVTGQSTVLSMSPAGSKFMAGSTLYDTATLAVSAPMNSANLAFFIAPTGIQPWRELRRQRIRHGARAERNCSMQAETEFHSTSRSHHSRRSIFPNTIRVYMNYRQQDQRGIIFPRPVSLSNAQGLQELILDEARERVYITNAGYNRIEIFDTKRQQFFEPLPVGQLPRSMAMSVDGYTLYVGNAGGESISIIDLDTLTVTGNIGFPPIPRAGNQNLVQPVAMAMGLSGLQFMMSNGTFWRVVGNEAVPRLENAITPASIGAPQMMIATPGGEWHGSTLTTAQPQSVRAHSSRLAARTSPLPQPRPNCRCRPSWVDRA